MTTPNPDLSIALATLLRGPLHAEDAPAVWTAVTTLGAQMRDHLTVLGLRLVVDDVERYAYLRTLDELPEGMPRLIRRHSLTYSVTVLLILLRQQLTTAEKTWIHRRSWVVERVVTHECPSELGRWDLSKVPLAAGEGHPRDASFAHRGRDVGRVR